MKNEREIALEILMEQSENRFIKSLYLKKFEKEKELSPVQKAWIKRLAVGVAERRITLDAVIRTFSKLRLKKIHPEVLMVLRISVYQMLYMDKVPMHSVVDEAIKIIKKRKHWQAVAFSNALLRNVSISIPEIQSWLEQKKKEGDWEVTYSCPKECLELLAVSYEQSAMLAVLEASFQERPYSVRLSRSIWESKDSISGLESGDLLPYARKFRGNPEESSAFQAGHFQIQDESSMLVGHILLPYQPQIILDLCAAPGGKSTHLADYLPKSEVTAFDVSEEKIAAIRQNQERLKLDNLSMEVWDATVQMESWQKKADAVLVDAPCSGLGVLSRKPDIKYRVNRGAVHDLAEIQKRILDNAAEYVKPGGLLLYSTCTILPQENEEQIQAFLIRHPEYFLVDISKNPIFQVKHSPFIKNDFIWKNEMLQILPYHWNGFFIALLQKQ